MRRTTQAALIMDREGFSIRGISDDLFDRMKAGKTYKEDCNVPREDLRYLLVLHKGRQTSYGWFPDTVQ